MPIAFLLRMIELTGTFNKIDYRLRPAKHCERSMLIDLFKRMQFSPIQNYQYVGLGSVAFVDFKMVHKALGVSKLISIEDVDDENEKKRFERNKPFDCVHLKFGNSKAVLPSLDFSQKSIVWMDYDDAFSRDIANDLSLIAGKASSGSLLATTFTTHFPTDPKEGRKEADRLQGEFPDFLEEGVKLSEFQGHIYANFCRTTLNSIIEKAISDADAGVAEARQKRMLKQVCFFRYKDGSPMVTYAWIILCESDLEKFSLCDFEGLPFVRTGEEPFRIKVPLVTPVEIQEMERRVPGLEANTEIEWIPCRERSDFEKIYRYLPHFSSVEQV